MNKKTVRDIDLANKRVLLRVDFNIPFNPGSNVVQYDRRIRSAIPTINYLTDHRARIVICSHLGRPKGNVVDELRLKPVADRLSALLNQPVAYAYDCVGDQLRQQVAELSPGQILMVENLRFHPEEESNQDSFAKELASLADLFVNDAFGVVHRAHASTVGVTRYLPSVAGLLMEQELTILHQVTENPRRPLAAILGGAKVADKMGVLDNLMDRVDLLLIGGGMAATFLLAQGHRVGKSIVEPERVEFAKSVITRASEKGVQLLLPTDVVITEELVTQASHRTVPVQQIPDGWLIADIGPETLYSSPGFQSALRQAGTVLWNGPMGVFEIPPFDLGTRAITNTLAYLTNAITVVGGGSTAEAVEEMGMTTGITHVSTGGGASLEFLEGKSLPGVAALEDK